MIVISGALVLLAAALLLIGLVAGGSSLTAIYVSIGLSIVAAVFLWLGINQRPAEVPAGVGARGGDDAAPPRGRRARPGDDDDGSDQKAPPPARSSAPSRAAPTEIREEPAEQDLGGDDVVEDSDAQTVAAAVATGADVFVVSGHPRYHLGDCPVVEGDDEAESLPIGEARDIGFVPCGVCRPDTELAEAAGPPDHVAGPAAAATRPVAEPAGVTPPVAEPAGPAAAVVPPAPTVPPASSVPPAPTMSPAPTVPPAAEMPAAPVLSPAPTVPPAAEMPAAPVLPPAPTVPPAAEMPAAPVLPPAPTVPPATVAPPAPPAQAAAPAAPAATASPVDERVVVLPGKARFHRPDCRLVSGPEQTEDLGKADAVRQGYLACAICKP